MVLGALLGLLASRTTAERASGERVTFDRPAAPIGRLFGELGKRVGIPLEAEAPLAKEVLLIRAADVPLTDLLKRIAQATEGVWKSTEAGLRLTFPWESDLRQRRQETAARAKDARIALDMLQQQRYNLSYLAYEEALKAGRVTRPTFLMESFLSGLGDDVLGDGRFAGRTVLSTEPSKTSRPFPPGIFRRPEALDFALGPKASRSAATKDGRTFLRPVLILQDGLDGESTDAEFRIYNAAGWPVTDVERNFRRSRFLKRRATTVLAHPEAPIGLGDEALRLAKLLTTVSTDLFERGAIPDAQVARAKGLPPETLDRLDSPDRFEPLEWSVGEPLRRMATAEGSSLVALIPDDAEIYSPWFLKDGTRAASAYAGYLTDNNVLLFSGGGGWLVARPVEPAAARDRRVDRVALARALRTLRTKGRLTLDDAALYATTAPVDDPSHSFEAALFGLFDPSTGARVAHAVRSGERRVLTLFEAVGGTAAMGGGERSLRVDDLPPAARRALNDLVFDSREGPYFSGPSWPPGGPDILPRGPEERTLRWPNGVPGNAHVVLRLDQTPSMAAPSRRLEQGGAASVQRTPPAASKPIARDSSRKVETVRRVLELILVADGRVVFTRTVSE